MHSPVFIPLLIAAAMCIGCLFAGGSCPHEYFQEWQPATIFNAIQLFFCAFLAAAVASTGSPKTSSPTPTLYRSSPVVASTLIWSFVCGAFVYAGFDELFEFHENSQPLAQWLSQWLGQPGIHPVIAGIEVPSYSALIELGYAVIVAVFVFVSHREVFAQRAAALMFALAALFLGGAQFVDLELIQGLRMPVSSDGAFCQGFFKAVACSLKLAGCAVLLGALMETLLAKRQLLSVERMLSSLNQKEQGKAASHREQVSV